MATEAVVVDAIKRVVFRSPDSAFCILALQSGLSALGDMRDPLEGEGVRFFGEYTSNPKWGRQFKFIRFERMAPVGTKAVRDYIVRIAKWVGPKVGDQIIAAYGERTLEILKGEPARVANEIKGITSKRAEEISQKLKGNESEEQLVLKLGELCSGRVPDNVMRAAIKEWGEEAPRVIKDDPYILTQLHGCGFERADNVARGLGIKGSDLRRLSAAIEYALQTAAGRDGHTRLTPSAVLELASEIAKCEATNEALDKIVASKRVVATKDYCALAKYDKAEKSVAAHLARIMASSEKLVGSPANLEGCAKDQLAAIAVCMSSPISALVGPPGTGKTWTLARLVEAYRGIKTNRIALAAPTGKAAKRMTESLLDTCGGTASTIHRLLEPQSSSKGRGGKTAFTFSRCGDNPLDIDLLVIDETSMLDICLADDLLSAVPSGCQVIFVGDDHQLPSIGPGAMLRDMLRADIPTARLTEIKRNAGEIVKACYAIKDGKAPSPNDKKLDLASGHNWRHFEIEDISAIAKKVVDLVSTVPAKGYSTEDAVVISPFNHRNERALSCMDFNNMLQKKLNPAQANSKSMQGGIREGDRVVRLSNGIANLAGNTVGDWPTPIVNGDIGEVDQIDDKYVYVTFENPERKVRLPRGEADLALAYALSCHKMQGSEAKVIIMPLHRSFGIFPSREWVYTAFSRAKDILVTVGTIATLGYWVQRQTNGLRQTGLESEITRARQ
jgi:exodeoxyribonuclease V alpha subunit